MKTYKYRLRANGKESVETFSCKDINELLNYVQSCGGQLIEVIEENEPVTPIMSIGNFYLGHNVDGLPVKRVKYDKVIKGLLSIGNLFGDAEEDVKDAIVDQSQREIYEGTNPISFLNIDWCISTTTINNKIDTVSAMYQTLNKNKADHVFNETFAFVKNSMGNYNENKVTSKRFYQEMFIWRNDQADVGIERAKTMWWHEVLFYILKPHSLQK